MNQNEIFVFNSEPNFGLSKIKQNLIQVQNLYVYKYK